MKKFKSKKRPVLTAKLVEGLLDKVIEDMSKKNSPAR